MTAAEKADFYRALIERTRAAYEGIDPELIEDAHDVLTLASAVGSPRLAELAESVRMSRVFFLSLSDILDDFDRMGGVP